jgi:hypothetical protein
VPHRRLDGSPPCFRAEYARRGDDVRCERLRDDVDTERAEFIPPRKIFLHAAIPSITKQTPIVLTRIEIPRAIVGRIFAM